MPTYPPNPNFPTSLPSLNKTAVKGSGDEITGVGTVYDDNNKQAAELEAIAAKVGVDGSSDPDSLDYKIAALPGLYVASTYLPVPVPSGLGFDSAYGLNLTLSDQGPSNRSAGDVGIAPEAMVDLFSGARTGTAYYVNVNQFAVTENGITYAAGSDSNNGLSPSTPFASIYKAIVAANSSGVARAYVAGGKYSRFNGLTNNGTAVFPTVDLVKIATGPVITGTFDLAISFSLATETIWRLNPTTGAAEQVTVTIPGVWQASRSNVDRVVDLLCKDRFGKYVELQNVPDLATCRRTPDSWALVSGILYVNRRDGLQPDTGTQTTLGNTRYYLGGPTYQATHFTEESNSIAFLAMPGAYWRIEGGSGLTWNSAYANQPNRKVFVMDRCALWFQGGLTSGYGVNAVSISTVNGLMWLNRCEVGGCAADAFNAHNAGLAGGLGISQSPHILASNCDFRDVGRVTGTSDNGFTIHENCRGISIANRYEDTHGYAIANIGTSRLYSIGDMVKNDLGTITGSLGPVSHGTADTAMMWTYRRKTDMGSGLAALANPGSQIFEREAWPSAVGVQGAVTTW